MSDAGENLIEGDLKGSCRLSEIGVNFLGGLIEHADAHAGRRPTANSYKRFWDVGYWAPFHKSYGFNNRSCLFRVHASRHRGTADGLVVQPVPVRGACLIAGLDGIRRGIDPGEPIEDNRMNDIRVPRDERIPITLNEAIDAFKADDLMTELLRSELYETFVGLRQDDLDRLWAQVSAWELDFYLERWP